MRVTSVNPRLLRFAIGAAVIAVIMLGVALCGPSHNSSTNTAKPTVSATAPAETWPEGSYGRLSAK